MPILKPGYTLPQLQQYQHDLCRERGWDKASELETFLLFSEEIGELAKAMRHRMKVYVESGKTQDNWALEQEFSDVFSYLLELANQFGVDLEAAFIRKEALNAARQWDSPEA
ncbi:MAG: MazG nucleotide pyrophosphohydrolase domain-containing protein [Bacteroidia bacterium]|nr:MazG nucleotide pyrophosphohydrolase domain-containing protein [Bacteroidia bacterium]